jgi:hypothetical protein
MSTTNRPPRAITTVSPAKTTAEPADRLLGFQTGGQFVPIAGHDEQGVVDRHREPDHHREDRRPGPDVDEAGRGRDRGGADAHSDDCRQQRQTGRDQRAEGDQQDHRGHADADHLGQALLLLSLHRVAAVLDGQTGRAGRLDRGGHRVPRLGSHLLGGDLVRDLGVAGPAVGRDRLGGKGIRDGLHLRRGSDPAERGLHGSGVVSGTELLAGRCLEDDPGRRGVRAGLRESLVEQVDRPL